MIMIKKKKFDFYNFAKHLAKSSKSWLRTSVLHVSVSNFFAGKTLFFFTRSLSYLINFRSWQQDSWRSFRLRGFSAQSNDASSKSLGSSFESLQILQSLAGITPFTTLSRTLKENQPLEIKKKEEKKKFLLTCWIIGKIWFMKLWIIYIII